MLTNHLLENQKNRIQERVVYTYSKYIDVPYKRTGFFFLKWVDLVSNLTRIEKKIKVRDFSKLRCYTAIGVSSNHRFLR